MRSVSALSFKTRSAEEFTGEADWSTRGLLLNDRKSYYYQAIAQMYDVQMKIQMTITAEVGL